ncbi:vitellogenin-like [Oratosquilla oratoria]|uniref:vitellogenin-like n=1 Tax=Oratosquilla oratoria TaxID=337810 RepID=UPI003F76EFCC
MPRIIRSWVALGLLVVISAVPLPPSEMKCATTCSGNRSKLQYLPGKTYMYRLIAHSSTEIGDTNANIHVDATVELSVLNACEIALVMKDYTVKDDREERVRVSELPLWLAMADGDVGHVCVDPKDDEISVNAKLGVASSMHNSLPALSEAYAVYNHVDVDIHGKCATKYSLTKSGDRIEVTKAKTNKDCSHRFYPRLEKRARAYLVNKVLPLKDSFTRCHQVIQNGIYSSIECTDNNVVGSVSAFQKSKLSFLSERPSDPWASPARQLHRRTLAYRAPEAPNPATNNSLEVDRDTKELCNRLGHDGQPVKEDAAKYVLKVTKGLRRDDPERVLQKIRKGEYCSDKEKLEEVFLDLLPFVGEKGIPAMVDAIASGAAGGRVLLYTLALHTVPRPSSHSVGVLKTLLDMEKPPHTILLAAGSVVRAHCHLNPRCYADVQVKSVMDRYLMKLQYLTLSEEMKKEKEQEILAVLKSIGNVGFVTADLAKKMIKMLQYKKNAPIIRVAAAQAFRNVPSMKGVPDEFYRVAMDSKDLVEVRLAAYLSGIKWFPRAYLEMILKYMKVESSRQVRNFIVSHLLIMQESDAPYNAQIRRRLAYLKIPDDYDGDFSRFSRNLDFSRFLPKMGLGIDASSIFIFSNNSIEPSFFSFDLTSEFLHETTNIFEVGARFEGFYSQLETLLSHSSYLTTASWKTIWKDILQYIQKEGLQVLDRVEKQVRSKRSINIASLITFLKKVQLPKRQTPTTPKTDAYIRLFGQEVSFGVISPDLKDFDVEQILDTLLKYIVFGNLPVSTARTLPVDFVYVIPTMLGAPLRLEVDGAAVIGLELEDKTKDPSPQDPQVLESHFRLVPSMSFQVDSFVGFELGQIRAGVMINKTLQSGPEWNVDIRVQKWKNIEITCDLPERLNLFSLKSASYLVDGSGVQRGILPSPNLHRSRKSCSKLRSLGIDVCYDTDSPGKVHNTLSLWAEKAEPSVNGYKFTATLKKHNEKSIKFGLLKLGGSRENIMGADIVYRCQEQNVTVFLNFSFPIGHCYLETSAVNKAQVKIAEFHADYVVAWAEGHHHWKGEILLEEDDVYNLESYYSHTRKFEPEDQVAGGHLFLHDVGDIVKLTSSHHTLNKLREIVSIDCNVSVDLLPFKVNDYQMIIPTSLHRLDTAMKIPSLNLSTSTKSDIKSSTNFEFSHEFSTKPNGYLVVFSKFTSSFKKEELRLKHQLDVPMLFDKVSYDVYMTMPEDMDRLNILSRFQHGRSVVTVEGVLSYLWYLNNVTCSSVFQIDGFSNGPYKISSELRFFVDNDDVMGKIHIRNKISNLFGASFSKTDTKITADLQVPPYIRADLDILLSKVLTMNLGVMGRIGPKGTKNYMAKLEYIMNPEQYGASARGYLLAGRKKYPYTVKVVLPSIITDAKNKENVLDIQVKSPTKKTLNILGKYEPGQTKSDWVYYLRTFDKQLYALEGYQRLKRNPNDYVVTRHASLKLSDLLAVAGKTVTHHEKTNVTRKLEIRAESKRWGLGPTSISLFTVMKQQKWEMSFSGISNDNQISSNGKLEFATPWWNCTGSVNVDAQLPGEPLSSVFLLAKKSSDPSMEFHLSDVFHNRTSERKLLVHRHSMTNTWVARINTPFRTLEAHMIPQFPVYTVKFWTNFEGKPNRVYEIQYRSPMAMGSENVKELRWSLLGPQMSKPIVIRMSHVKQASLTSVDVDVYQKEEDKTKISISITKESEASYWANAIVKSQIVENSPSVDIHFTTTQELKSLNITYKNQHSNPAGEIDVKWDESHPGKVVATALMRNPQSKIDVSSVINQEETTECHGYQAENHIFSPSGCRHLGVLLCSPLFVGVNSGGLADKGSEMLYHVHAGVRNPREAALVVLKEDVHENKAEPIAGVQLNLRSPYLNKVTLTYQEAEVAYLKRKLVEVASTWRRASLIPASVRKTIETRTKSLGLDDLFDSIHEDWRKITAELNEDSLILVLRKLYDSNVVYESSRSKVESFTEICNSFMQIYRKLTLKTAKEIANIGQIMYKETTKALQKNIPDYAEEIWQILRIQSYWMQEKLLPDDLRYMWAEGLTTEEIDSYVQYIVEAVTEFSANPDQGKLSFPIPMVRPVHSILQVPSGFNVSDALPSLRNFISELGFFVPKLYVPWGSVQASLGGSGVLRTFDGLTLHVRPSNCQYVLATDKNDYIVIEFDEGEWSQVAMTTMNRTCSVQIDESTQVSANGHPVSTGNICNGYVAVKDWPWQVVVEMPWLTVSVNKIRSRDVVVELGVFYKNRLAGLLGTYNDVTGDDMTTPSGQIAFSPSSFLDAWKISPYCQ